MRFRTALFVALFAAAVAVSADDRNSGRNGDDHDDDRPVRPGWAVVTPSSGSGLTVFSTFGMRKGSETTQAGVLPPNLTTSAVMFVTSSGRLGRNLGVALVNPGSTTVTVTLTLKDQAGVTLASRPIQVGSKQQVSQFVTELFASQSAVPREFAGSLTMASTGPVSAIGLRFRGDNFSTLPVTALAGTSTVPQISTGVGGTGAILLPQFASGGGWSSEIVVMNTSSAAIAFRVDLFAPDGTPLVASLNGQSQSSFTNLTVPAGGVFILAPRDSNGDSRH